MTGRKKYRRISKVERSPYEIDLKKAHLGLVGNKRNIHEQLKYLLAQLNFFQSLQRTADCVYPIAEHIRRTFNICAGITASAIGIYQCDLGGFYSEQIRDHILGVSIRFLKERKLKQEEEKKAHIFLPYLLFIIDEPKLILKSCDYGIPAKQGNGIRL